MINVSFTPRVGVAPGTTTLVLNDGGPGGFDCLGDGSPCLPEPTNPYSSYSASSAVLPRGGAPSPHAITTASVPYGTESLLKDSGGQVTLLGAAPFGLSWQSFLILVGVAVVGGGGLAYLASRR